MAEANERSNSAVKEQKQQGDSNTPAPNQDDDTKQARLGILQAVERNDISVEQALNLLDELEA